MEEDGSSSSLEMGTSSAVSTPQKPPHKKGKGGHQKKRKDIDMKNTKLRKKDKREKKKKKKKRDKEGRKDSKRRQRRGKWGKVRAKWRCPVC